MYCRPSPLRIHQSRQDLAVKNSCGCKPQHHQGLHEENRHSPCTCIRYKELYEGNHRRKPRQRSNTGRIHIFVRDIENCEPGQPRNSGKGYHYPIGRGSGAKKHRSTRTGGTNLGADPHSKIPRLRIKNLAPNLKPESAGLSEFG